jgi:hypothetical protein
LIQRKKILTYKFIYHEDVKNLVTFLEIWILITEIVTFAVLLYLAIPIFKLVKNWKTFNLASKVLRLLILIPYGVIMFLSGGLFAIYIVLGIQNSEVRNFFTFLTAILLLVGYLTIFYWLGKHMKNFHNQNELKTKISYSILLLFLIIFCGFFVYFFFAISLPEMVIWSEGYVVPLMFIVGFQVILFHILYLGIWRIIERVQNRH